MTKIFENHSDVNNIKNADYLHADPDQQPKYIQRQLELYDNLEPPKQREFFEVALEELEELQGKHWGRGQRIQNLEQRFNLEILRQYPRTCVRYAQEILVWHMMLHSARERGRRRAKSKEFLYLFETDGKKFAKRFGFSDYMGRKVLKRLDEMGIVEWWDRKRDKQCFLYLGEEWLNDSNFPIRYTLFRLTNKRVKDFFDREEKK